MQIVRSTLLYCLLLFFPRSSFCQKITSSLSEKIETRFDPARAVRCGNKYIGYIMQDRDRSRKNNDDCRMEITEYDNQYKELRSVNQANGERVFFSGLGVIIGVNNKPWLIYRDAAPKNTITNVLAAEIDTVTLTLRSPKNVAEIASTDQELNLGRRVAVEISPDKRTTLLDVSDGGNNHFVSVLDENMNVVWSKLVDFSPNKLQWINAIKVDNEHNVYICYTLKSTDLQTEKENPVWVRLYTHDQQQKDIKIEAGTVDLVLAHLNLIHSGKNSVYLTGGYRKSSNKSKLEGLFYGEISQNNFQAPVLIKQAFSVANVEHADEMGWGSVKEKKYGIDLPTQLVPFLMEDGSIDFVGGYVKSVSAASGQTLWTRYLGIINLRMDSHSAVASYIPWKSLKVDPLFGNITAYPFKNKMIIFYTDDPKFLKKSLDNRDYSGDDYPEAMLLAATVSPDGSITRQKVIEQQEEFISLYSKIFERAPNTLSVCIEYHKELQGEKKGTKKWVTIKVEE